MGAAKAEAIGTLATGETLVRMGASELEPCAEGKPHWIHILPPGPHVEARDGRKFVVEDLEAVAAASELPMLVDWEHASEAGDTRASGWIEELKVEPASAKERAGLWGRVDWTPQGRDHVSTRHYRFLSPVVIGKRSMQKETLGQFHVERLTSVALTNRPALRMQGIEQLRAQMSTHRVFVDEGDQSMDKLRTAMCTALGLSADSSEDAIVAAFKPILDAAKANNGDTASLREALSTMTTERNELSTKVTTLEAELASFRKSKAKSDVEQFFTEGARAGKIPPAAREKWLAFALKSDANFETFKADIYPGLPVVGEPAPRSKPGKAGGAKQRFSEKSPNGVDRAALRRLGFTEEQILESENEVFAPKDKSRGPDDDEDDENEDDDAGEGAGDRNGAAGAAAGQGET